MIDSTEENKVSDVSDNRTNNARAYFFMLDFTVFVYGFQLDSRLNKTQTKRTNATKNVSWVPFNINRIYMTP